MEKRKNFVRDAFDRRGLTPAKVFKLGIPYQSAYRQYRGERFPSAEFAVLYETVLGIPRGEIRPDLWDIPTDYKDKSDVTI